MEQILSVIGVSTVVSIVVSFIFDTIKYRNNLKYERLFDVKQSSYSSMLVFMSIVMDVDNYKHVTTKLTTSETDEESIIKYYKNELELNLKYSVLYADKKVINCLSEFIEMPTEENYEKTAMEMRNDLWKKKYKWNSLPSLPKNSTTFNTQHGNN